MRTFLLLAGLIGVAAPLYGQGWIDPGPGRVPGTGVVKLRTSVAVRVVTDRIARVEVEEWFQNRGGRVAEGDYLYPLPGEAVFSNFSLYQGDRELRGETMDAARARQIYEAIVRRRKDPALIELAGHGLIRARVFPIEPGQTRKITLRYTQVLERAGDALQFRYAAGAAFGGTQTTAEGRFVAPGQVPGGASAPLTFVLTAEDGANFRDPFSPTHELRISREDGRLEVRPESELAGDFTLFLPLARGLVGVTLATHRPSSEDGYFMLLLSPGEAEGPATPRDVTVVVDVSGSMAGTKMDQARQALRQLLGSLGRRDRFRLVSFSSGVSVFRSGWTEAEGAAMADARRWVDRLDAEGGTNIAAALAEAFRETSPEDRLPIVVFLTDGLPSVGETDPERIAEQAERSRGRARVFAFGVGYDVNTYLLDRLSAAGRGATAYVEPNEDVEVALGALAMKIRHPVLTDLEIAGAPVRLTEIYPRRLPDLFAGEELIVFGRYEAEDEDRSGMIRLHGMRSGRLERFAAEVLFPEHALGNDFVPRLWASRKIGALMQEIRLNGADPELVEAVRETALRYGILTQYTSHLVQEPTTVASRGGGPGRPLGIDPSSFNLRPATPQASHGRAAVAVSERARARREVTSAADLAAVEAAAAPAAAAAGASTRTVAGRIFRLEGDLWIDARHPDDQRIVHIEPFGSAYFELLRQAPELVPILRAFERVLIAGDGVSIRVAPGGLDRMPAGDVGRLVNEFRGI